MHHRVVSVHGRWNVLVWVTVGRVGYDEGGFTYGSIADKYAFDFVTTTPEIKFFTRFNKEKSCLKEHKYRL